MNTQDKLFTWLRDMNYDGNIPNKFSMCNASTAFIWEQLMHNILPIHSANTIKENVIIARLKKQRSNEPTAYIGNIEEISTYEKKVALEAHLHSQEVIYRDLETKVDNLKRDNNVQYLMIESVQSKRSEYEQRIFMLDTKMEMISDDIKDNEDAIRVAKNLTPVEVDASQNTPAEITQILTKCAEKLRVMVRERRLTVKRNFADSQPTTAFTCTSMVASTPQVHHKNDNSCRSLYGNYLTVEAPLRRALLPDDRFLSTTPEPFINRNEISDCPSVVLPRTPKSSALGVHSSLQPSTDSYLWTLCQQKCQDGELDVDAELSHLLHSNNRQLLLRQCLARMDDLHYEIRKFLVNLQDISAMISGKVKQSDLLKLYNTHIKVHLSALKIEQQNLLLQDQITKCEEQLRQQLPESMHELLRQRMTDIEADADIAVLQEELVHQEQIRQNNDLLCANTEFASTLAKLQTLWDNSNSMKNAILESVNDWDRLLKRIEAIQRETASHARQLTACVFNLDWADSLLSTTNADEIRLFDRFPLEFNRQFHFTAPSTIPHNGDGPSAERTQPNRLYFRDIAQLLPVTSVEKCLEADTAHQIVSMVGETFRPFMSMCDGVLAHITCLETLQNATEPPQVDLSYDLSLFETDESYVDHICDKFAQLLHSEQIQDIRHMEKDIKEMLSIWEEMPFGRYISDKVTLNGQPYSFYEKKIRDFYEK